MELTFLWVGLRMRSKMEISISHVLRIVAFTKFYITYKCGRAVEQQLLKLETKKKDYMEERNFGESKTLRREMIRLVES